MHKVTHVNPLSCLKDFEFLLSEISEFPARTVHQGHL